LTATVSTAVLGDLLGAAVGELAVSAAQRVPSWVWTALGLVVLGLLGAWVVLG
jgi:hypothetical protein